MATRSNIGILNEDGTVTSIYCHWDGYPECVGKTLVNHYQDEDKIRHLISLGSISVLGEEVAPPVPITGDIESKRVRGILERFEPPLEHTFDSPLPGITIAYHRDRGEEFQIITHDSLIEYFRFGWVDYLYLFKDGEWYLGGKMGSREVKKILKMK